MGPLSCLGAKSGEIIMSLEFTSTGAIRAADLTALSRPNLFARAAAWMRAARHHRRQMRQLQAMDGHLLADLGITRAQAEYLAQQPYAGDWTGALFPCRQR
jgi:uncharacterized protein YjiS (DUF1127 family)